MLVTASLLSFTKEYLWNHLIDTEFQFYNEPLRNHMIEKNQALNRQHIVNISSSYN